MALENETKKLKEKYEQEQIKQELEGLKIINYERYKKQKTRKHIIELIMLLAYFALGLIIGATYIYTQIFG